MAELCAPNVPPDTIRRIASVESDFNPYAIGVVGGRLQRQPRTREEALATADMLAANGWNYSVGIVQVNQRNFGKYGLNSATAFDPCTNLRVGGLILEDCYKRARKGPAAVSDALSCYYSGNFSTGYRLGYVARVQAVPGADTGNLTVSPIPVIESVRMRTHRPSVRGQAAGEGTSPFLSMPTANTQAAANSPRSSTSKGGATALLF